MSAPVPDAPSLSPRQRWEWRAAYGAPAAIAAVVAAMWFEPGRFVAAGDVAPFIRDNLRSEMWSAWSHQLSGGGSTSYEMVRLVEVAFLRGGELAGLGAPDSQQAFYAVVAAFTAFGVAFWGRSLSTRPVAAALAGLLAVFNPYVLVTLPNVLPMLSIGVAGLLGGLLLRAGAGGWSSPLVLALATLPVSYLGLNPPLVAVLAGWVGVCAGVVAVAHGRAGLQRCGSLLLVAAPLVLLFHLWWLVPAAQTLGGHDAGIQMSAEIDVDAWAWSHASNTLANVTMLKAHWGWFDPQYYPYAASLDTAPWGWLAWMLPLGAVLGAVTADGRRRRTCLALAVVALLLVVVAKGLHEPFAGVNRALYGAVPGSWLLREPMSKVGALLVPIYAGLFAVAVERGLDRLGRLDVSTRTTRLCRRGATAALTTAAVLALAFPLPLWSGAVIPPARERIPSMHVRIPEVWQEAARTVNASPVEGKALILPLVPQYQMPTTWGYHGVDGVAQQLITRPVIQPLPNGYFAQPAGLESLVRSVEESLAVGDVAALPRAMDALGLSHLVIRRDLVQRPEVGLTASPEELAATARRLPGWRAAQQSVLVDVFERVGSAPVLRTAQDVSGSDLRSQGDADTDAALVRSARSGGAVVDPSRDAPAGVAARSWVLPVDRDTTSFTVERRGTYELSSQLRANPFHQISTETARTGSRIRVRTSLDVRIDDVPMQTPSDEWVELNAPGEAIEVAGRAHALPPDELRLLAPAGAEASVWGTPRNVPMGPFSGVGGCAGPLVGSAGRVERVGGVTRLAATGATACVAAAVEQPIAPVVYRVAFEYRVTRGFGVDVCVWETGPEHCADVPHLFANETWRPYVAYMRADRATTGVRVQLQAKPFVTGQPTVGEFRGLTISQLAEVGRATLSGAPAEPVMAELGAGDHEVTVAGMAAGDRQLEFSGLEDCNALETPSVRYAELGLERDERVIRLSARSHSACTSAVVDSPITTGLYHATFDYRTLSGQGARVCLWQVGVNRCADLATMSVDDRWRSVDAFVQPEPGTTALRLYLYADGGDERRRKATVTEFRDVEVSPVAPLTAVVTERPRAEATPAITWNEVDPSHYRARVDGARGPFILGLAETYSGDWALEGLPEGWSAEHVTVDGYANGWRVRGYGTADLHVRFAPASRDRRAALASAVALCGALGVLARCGVRRYLSR